MLNTDNWVLSVGSDDELHVRLIDFGNAKSIFRQYSTIM